MIQQLLRPVRALRGALRRVRYYSATRPLTRLERVGEMAMLVMLFAGLPAAWLLDLSIVVTQAPPSVAGLIHQAADGSRVATSGPEEGRRGRPPSGADLAGGFTVTLTRVDRGWPFATTVVHRPALVDLEIYLAPKESRRGAPLASDPVSAAIESVLSDLGYEHGVTRARLGAWVANAVILSVLLPFVTWVAFAAAGRLAAIASGSRRAARRERRASGRCAACGYDLRGNVRGARCPECGNVSG